MRKLVVFIAAVAALAAGIGAVSAAGGADVHTRTVNFTLSSAACPNLDPGTRPVIDSGGALRNAWLKPAICEGSSRTLAS